MTVIVPAFDAERTLAHTLRAAIGQTYRNLEIIVVDDGSTDTTRIIALGYAKTDPRIIVVSQPNLINSGVASARNIGLAAARGRYVALLDADDLWHPDHVTKLMEYASAKGCDMVIAQHRLIDEHGYVLSDGRPVSILGNALCRMMHFNWVGNGSSLLVKRTAAIAAGCYDESLRHAGAEGCEDYLFQLELCANGAIIATAPYLVGYRKGANVMSADFDRMTVSLELALRLFVRNHPGLMHIRRPARWHIARSLRQLSAWRLRRGCWWGALTCAVRASILDPIGASAFLWRHIAKRPKLDAGPEDTPRTPFFDLDPHIRMACALAPADWLARLEERRSQRLEKVDKRTA